MNPTLSEQQLEELRPLAAAIEGAITDTPIRLGTDDWGTALAATILVRVAAYMGGVLPAAAEPGDWLTRGTRDLSIPEHDRAADKVARRSAEEEQTLRLLRRESLLVLLTRLQRGRTLSGTEADALRQHVETEIREADTARSIASGNKRHVQQLIPEIDRLTAELTDYDQRVEQLEATAEQHARNTLTVACERDSYRKAWKYEQQRRARAEAALARINALAEEHPAGIDTALILAALDGDEQPTTEA
ncbi:hypothetical protein [Streptomyces cellulosae]|uniref:hypothetical protein n=1 Tax=Streptomyces cellulosae TaxID=1968 RepID=UPI0004CC7120|nr:hypothetical protein [Streptomyces cellulosae]